MNLAMYDISCCCCRYSCQPHTVFVVMVAANIVTAASRELVAFTAAAAAVSRI